MHSNSSVIGKVFGQGAKLISRGWGGFEFLEQKPCRVIWKYAQNNRKWQTSKTVKEPNPQILVVSYDRRVLGQTGLI